jgi:hypothetical protein
MAGVERSLLHCSMGVVVVVEFGNVLAIAIAIALV